VPLGSSTKSLKTSTTHTGKTSDDEQASRVGKGCALLEYLSTSAGNVVASIELILIFAAKSPSVVQARPARSQARLHAFKQGRGLRRLRLLQSATVCYGRPTRLRHSSNARWRNSDWGFFIACQGTRCEQDGNDPGGKQSLAAGDGQVSFAPTQGRNPKLKKAWNATFRAFTPVPRYRLRPPLGDTSRGGHICKRACTPGGV
jgi:hypothetical protein